MLEDLLYDPVMAVWVFFRVKPDAFQGARLRYYWFTRFTDDSSGYTSAKTICAWWAVNLAAVLIPNTQCMAIYQTFQRAKDNFWPYYSTFSTALWKAQLGRIEMGDEKNKAASKEAGCWKVSFKNGSRVDMPAPGFLTEGANMAGLRTNRLYIDEKNKIMSSEGGMAAITVQLLTRVTREEINQHHPVWCNKVLMTSTAELGDHPAAVLHAKHEKKALSGNPDYASFSFSYKDYSNLKSSTLHRDGAVTGSRDGCATAGIECFDGGKTFKERFRNEKQMQLVKENNTPEKAAAEGLGVWGKYSQKWYSLEMIQACRELGASRGLEPILSSADDPLRGVAIDIRYFLGLDPAPAQGQKSDDGTMMVLRAALMNPKGGDNESDWQLDFVLGRRVRRTDVEGWGGLIHDYHGRFGFALMVMDLGGGGQWIMPHLKKTRQVINGIATTVVPILPRHTSVMEGAPIMVMLTRGEEDIKKLWVEMKHAKGDDVLKDSANTMFRTAIERTQIGMPIAHNERKAETVEGWPEEKLWGSKVLTALGSQCVNYRVKTDQTGHWALTKNQSKQFFSLDKDDIHDAGRNAYIGFRIWLLEATVEMSGEDAALGDGG
jgi:hypothetical protein